jgi:hypothetical protein
MLEGFQYLATSGDGSRERTPISRSEFRTGDVLC